MNKRELKKRLADHAGRTIDKYAMPAQIEKTADLCIAVMRRQANAPAEPRLGFWRFLSGVFRFEWPPILGLQAAALLLAGLFLCGASKDLKYLPVFMPLFILAAVPVVFQGQYFGTSELEAVTRSSGAQIVLAKLILAGAANLVCMTMLLWLEVRLTGGVRDLGRMILYCLAPYLVCMTMLLRLIRSGRKNGMALAVAASLGSCLFWRILSRVSPGLYELSAVGVWIAAFTVFSAFFAREIGFIVKANKEGKMYGTVV